MPFNLISIYALFSYNLNVIYFFSLKVLKNGTFKIATMQRL